MDNFIELLTDIENDNSIMVYNDFFDRSHEKIRTAASMASDFLIMEDGHCNWDNIDILGDIGIRVFAGEQDRFGWVTGCIGLKNGIIVYG
jgi:hypothetical protein